jgi:two-component sensor histidine kinase
MPRGDEFDALLQFLTEPVFVLSPAGDVLNANAAAHQLLGADPAGRNLADLAADGDAVTQYLRRCSGTTAPLLGALALRSVGGAELKLRTYGARLGGVEPPRLALRCTPLKANEFSVLAQKVRALNAEIRERRRTQAALEETLRDNHVLFRELQHRVKNNIQSMLGMFSAARREARSPELRDFLEGASQRLLAIGAVQQLMYQAQQLDAVSAPDFVQTVCAAVRAGLGPEAEITARAVPEQLPNDAAFPLALILNELLTNAVKYGLRDGRGAISVVLDRQGDELELVVKDEGPGIMQDAPERRASGLGLVRGLCRQIGGRLDIGNQGGARCAVRFPRRSRTLQ